MQTQTSQKKKKNARAKKTKGRDLTSLPVFGPELAECERCELKPQCEKEQTATSYRPEKFNGIMIVGEGPGHHEVVSNEPFVGRSGQLLTALLKEAGIVRDECYLTNSTLCKPTMGSKKDSLHASFPSAIHACLPRLDAEIEAVKPRVIVPTGAAALVSITGYEQTKTTRVPFTCPDCDNETRKIGPVIECTAKSKETGKKCGWFLEAPSLPPQTTSLEIEERVEIVLNWFDSHKPKACPNCSAKLKNQKPKMIKCRTCDGKKTKPKDIITFKHDYKISEVAGAIFKPETLESRYNEFGVKYIIPTYHPAFLLRPPPPHSKVMAGQYVAEPVVKHFQKAKRFLTKELDWDVKHFITKDADEVSDYLYAWESEHDECPYNFAVDIETEAWGKDEKDEDVQLDARKPWLVTSIRCIGIGCRELGKIMVVDTREASGELIAELEIFLEDASIPKTFQNGPYDITVMKRLWDVDTAGYTDDTAIAHHGLCPDESHKLPHISFSYLDIEVWKPPRELRGVEAHANFEELALYNARDVLNTADDLEAMGARNGKASAGGPLSRASLSEIYELDMKMHRIGLQMHLDGMPLNEEALKRVGVEARRKADDALNAMRKIINEPAFKPTQKQLQWVLYDPDGPLKLVPPSRTKTGQGTTAKDELAKLVDEPFIQHLLESREHEKIVGTYILGEELHTEADGRLHPSWNTRGTVTGRWSSFFQTWPKWLRACIEAMSGRKIVGADFSQLELRIMAALSGDARLIERCMNADENRKLDPECDPHSFVAALVFNKAFLDLKMEDPDHDKENERCRCDRCSRDALRTLCKRIVFGLNYGAGAATVLASIYAGGYKGPPITLDMVIRTTKTLFTEFPSIPVWRNRMLKEANAAREIRSPMLGRRRVFPLGLIEAPVVYNFPIQSSAADIINTRFAILSDELPKVDPSAFPIAQVHDAIYVECDAKKARKVAKLVEETLSWTTSLGEGVPEMPFVASAKIGDNWQQVS